MGRYTTSRVSGVYDEVFKITAGAQISENDVVEIGPDGQALPVVCADYAAVANYVYGATQNSAANGQIVAQTQIVAASKNNPNRQQVLRGAGGSIYALTPQSAGIGLMLSKYSPSLGLLANANVNDDSTEYAIYQMFFLSNGNICICAISTSNKLQFAIFDTNLVTVKAITTIIASAGLRFSACTLSEGGFAVVFQVTATPLQSQLVTYDNAGNVATSPVTIWTRTGTSGLQGHRIAQLSDGNLVVAVASANTVSSIGLFHGVVTTSGASIAAFTNIDTSTQAGAPLPELSVLNGYYAISALCGSNQKAFIASNDGVVQGAPFSSAGGSGAEKIQKLLNDGEVFFLIWSRTTDSKEILTKLPVTGTNYKTSVITTASPTNYQSYVDAFYEQGYIVATSQPGSAANTTPFLWVIDTATQTLVTGQSSSFGVAPGTASGSSQCVIPGSDFSFICMYDYATSPSTSLFVGKYASTAIIGVAQQSANAGELVRVAGVAGAYTTNKVLGSATKAFDHSATNINGNKGTLLNYGCALKGL